MRALRERREAEAKQDVLCAGIVASAIYNTNRTKKSDPVVRPQDFLREEPNRMTPKEALRFMKAWARSVSPGAEA